MLVFTVQENESVICIHILYSCSVTKSYPMLWHPVDSSRPGCSVHEIFQARILEWVAISSSRGSSQSRDQTHISCMSCVGRQILYPWNTWEASGVYIPLPFEFPIQVTTVHQVEFPFLHSMFSLTILYVVSIAFLLIPSNPFVSTIQRFVQFFLSLCMCSLTEYMLPILFYHFCGFWKTSLSLSFLTYKKRNYSIHSVGCAED